MVTHLASHSSLSPPPFHPKFPPSFSPSSPPPFPTTTPPPYLLLLPLFTMKHHEPISTTKLLHHLHHHLLLLGHHQVYHLHLHGELFHTSQLDAPRGTVCKISFWPLELDLHHQISSLVKTGLTFWFGAAFFSVGATQRAGTLLLVWGRTSLCWTQLGSSWASNSTRQDLDISFMFVNKT